MFYVMFFDIVLFYIINAIRCDWSLWGVVIWQNLSCSWHSQVPILNSEKNWKKLVVSEFRNGCRYVVSNIIIQKMRQNTRFLFFWLCKFVILKVGGLFLRAGGYWLQFHICFFFPLIWWFISFVGFIILFTQLSFYQT